MSDCCLRLSARKLALLWFEDSLCQCAFDLYHLVLDHPKQPSRSKRMSNSSGAFICWLEKWCCVERVKQFRWTSVHRNLGPALHSCALSAVCVLCEKRKGFPKFLTARRKFGILFAWVKDFYVLVALNRHSTTKALGPCQPCFLRWGCLKHRPFKSNGATSKSRSPWKRHRSWLCLDIAVQHGPGVRPSQFFPTSHWPTVCNCNDETPMFLLFQCFDPSSRYRRCTRRAKFISGLSAKTSLAHMAGISLETRLGVFFRTLEFRRFQIGK